MTWYRSLLPDGTLWAETSSPDDWHLRHDEQAVTFQRLDASGWTTVGQLGPHDSALSREVERRACDLNPTCLHPVPGGQVRPDPRRVAPDHPGA